MRAYQRNETIDWDIELTPAERRAQFLKQALAKFDSLPVGWEGLSELWVALWDLKAPNPNCWGGFVSLLKKQGRVVSTGQRWKMVKPRSHGRRTDVLRKVW